MNSIGAGDRLARGARKAQFPASEKTNQEKWDEAFPKEKTPEKKGVYLLKCPVHGTFVSDKEFFMSGGYPQLDEYTMGKCLEEDCYERATYAGFQPL